MFIDASERLGAEAPKVLQCGSAAADFRASCASQYLGKSYVLPLLETSAAAPCGTTGILSSYVILIIMKLVWKYIWGETVARIPSHSLRFRCGCCMVCRDKRHEVPWTNYHITSTSLLHHTPKHHHGVYEVYYPVKALRGTLGCRGLHWLQPTSIIFDHHQLGLKAFRCRQSTVDSADCFTARCWRPRRQKEWNHVRFRLAGCSGQLCLDGHCTVSSSRLWSLVVESVALLVALDIFTNLRIQFSNGIQITIRNYQNSHVGQTGPSLCHPLFTLMPFP